MLNFQQQIFLNYLNEAAKTNSTNINSKITNTLNLAQNLASEPTSTSSIKPSIVNVPNQNQYQELKENLSKKLLYIIIIFNNFIFKF